jgi:hypothetical protein
LPIRVYRYDLEGNLLGEIESGVLDCNTDQSAYGGCDLGRLVFTARWGDDFVTSKTEAIKVISNEVPVFAGRVVSVAPTLEESRQSVEAEGWWRRLAELEVVKAPTDRLVFGAAQDSTHPEITKVSQLIQWLVDHVIMADPQHAAESTNLEFAQYSCKFGSFAIYSGDSLTDVLENLAMMDDCLIGIDAEKVLYLKPRETVLATTLLEVHIAEDPPAEWRQLPYGVGTGGDFIEDRRGPNHLSLHTRDLDLVQGIRTYRLLNVLDGSRRQKKFRCMNVRNGQGARRLARGLFRRYTDYGLKAENVQFLAGSWRFEPHLGAYAVYNLGDLVVTKIASAVNISWTAQIKGTVTLGDNEPKLGGGQINDPFDSTGGDSDEPQIDTGLGEDDPNYDLPSSDIDFEDGFNGDGDDLHQNDDRADWEDPPADPPGVDYGKDKTDESNGASSGGARAKLWKMQVLNETHPTYSIKLLRSNGSTYKSYNDISAWPEITKPLLAGAKGLAFFNDTDAKPTIVGMEVSGSGSSNCALCGAFAD